MTVNFKGEAKIINFIGLLNFWKKVAFIFRIDLIQEIFFEFPFP